MSQNYRDTVHRWLRSTGFNMSRDQINCLVRVLQQHDRDIPAHAFEPMCFAYFAGLKFERERSASMASRHLT